MDFTLILFLVLGLAGLGLLIAGAWVLLGLGAGLIASGLACLSAALFLQKGMANG